MCIQGFCKVTIEFSKVGAESEKVQYSLHSVQVGVVLDDMLLGSHDPLPGLLKSGGEPV